MKLVKLAVLAIAAFLLGGVVERARTDQTPCDASAAYCTGAAFRHALLGGGAAPAVPPTAAPANPFEQYQPAAAPVDDQIARINADLARDRQVEEDAKVQARAIADELRRR